MSQGCIIKCPSSQGGCRSSAHGPWERPSPPPGSPLLCSLEAGTLPGPGLEEGWCWWKGCAPAELGLGNAQPLILRDPPGAEPSPQTSGSLDLGTPLQTHFTSRELDCPRWSQTRARPGSQSPPWCVVVHALSTHMCTHACTHVHIALSEVLASHQSVPCHHTHWSTRKPPPHVPKS